MKFGPKHRRFVDEDQRVLPLINVVFLLLIFFLVAGQLSRTDPISVEPPLSDSEKETGDGGIRLFVTSEGEIHSDSGVLSLDQVGALVRGAGRNVGTVWVKADGNADAVGVVAILNTVREAGAEKVRLLTTTRQ